MRGFWAALVLAAALQISPSASAQSADDAEMVRQFSAWSDRLISVQTRMGEANGALRRTTAAVRAANGDRAAVLAALRAATPELQQARATLASLRLEAEAIPPFGGDNAPAMFIVTSNLVLGDTIWMLEQFELIAADAAQLGPALEAGDNARLRVISERLMAMPAVMLRSQTTTLRVVQFQYPDDDTTHHVIGARIAVFDGVIAFVTLDEAVDPDAILGASNAIERWVASGRAALAAERGLEIDGDAETRAAFERIFATHDQQLELAAAEAAALRAYAGTLGPNTPFPERIAAMRAMGAMEAQQDALQEAISAEARSLFD